MRGGWRALVLVTVLAGACSPYTVSERPDDPLSPSSAYLYGRFELDSRGSRNSMGFVVRCTDGEKDQAFDIGFSSKHPLQVFKIAPGTCVIDEMVYTASGVKRVDSSTVRRRWGITEFRNDYARTTAEMKHMFPKLAALPTEDAMGRR
jgi:hypothetical protein